MKRISKCQFWRLLKGYWASSVRCIPARLQDGAGKGSFALPLRPVARLAQVQEPGCACGEAGGGGGLGEEMTMNGRDLFTKVDKQVSELKERIARQSEAKKRAKQRGHY